MRLALIALVLLLPSVALAADSPPPAKAAVAGSVAARLPIEGDWQVHLSAEEQAQIDALKKSAEAQPEDGMAKAMLKAVLAAAEARLSIDSTTLTFQVMGETVPAKYSAKADGAAWSLTTTTPEGEEKTLTASITADGMLALTDPTGQTSTFKRVGVK